MDVFISGKENRCYRLIKKAASSFILLLIFIIEFCLFSPAIAGNPEKASYNWENTNIFWFALISDTHIGNPLTTEDNANLEWFVGEGYETINPKLIINTGDLTDHLRCNPVSGDWPCDHPGEWLSGYLLRYAAYLTFHCSNLHLLVRLVRHSLPVCNRSMYCQ